MPVRRRREVSPLTVVAAVVVLTALVLGATGHGGGLAATIAGPDGVRYLPSFLQPRVFVEIDGRPVRVPQPEPSVGRPLAAVPVTTSGNHAFLHVTDDGAPVGYDPCRPVRYVVRAEGAPPGGEEMIADAVAIVSAASGLALVPAGATDEPPAMERDVIQPDRYGPGWAPVLVAWSTAQELPALEGQVAGVGGSASVPGADGTGTWLAGGRVVLDAQDLGALLATPAGYPRARAIAVHELAHVLGLDHVDDPSELMHPVTSQRTDLGPGDLEGLALLGQVACEE